MALLYSIACLYENVGTVWLTCIGLSAHRYKRLYKCQQMVHGISCHHFFCITRMYAIFE